MEKKKISLNELKSLVKKIINEQYSSIEENVDNENYMFWQNIKNIHHSCDEILNMDKVHVNNILNNGHDWAIDHVSTSFDDIEEVYHFLDSNIENNIN
jgi:Asp-tRNA(Asn)/Glu-tRNA(Gln) amidotransferase B subunit